MGGAGEEYGTRDDILTNCEVINTHAHRWYFQIVEDLSLLLFFPCGCTAFGCYSVFGLLFAGIHFFENFDFVDSVDVNWMKSNLDGLFDRKDGQRKVMINKLNLVPNRNLSYSICQL